MMQARKIQASLEKNSRIALPNALLPYWRPSRNFILRAAEESIGAGNQKFGAIISRKANQGEKYRDPPYYYHEMRAAKAGSMTSDVVNRI